jgi:hypothetical protein
MQHGSLAMVSRAQNVRIANSDLRGVNTRSVGLLSASTLALQQIGSFLFERFTKNKATLVFKYHV